MDKETRDKFASKVADVCTEFGVENVSLCGTCGNLKPGFIGILLLDKKENPSMGAIFEATANVGRLWQHSRMIVRATLNDFERQV